MSNANASADADCDVETAACAAVEMVIRPREKDLGGSFRVRRVLPFHKRRAVGPFIFFDHFGPVTYPPGEGLDVRPHPHIGLATVTYLFEGAIRHRDTLGNDLVIRPGAVNLMTAGRGIVHSERTPPEARASGHALHGLQTWLALPKGEETNAPAFSHHGVDTLPLFEEGGARLRLLMGEAFGKRSPVPFPAETLYLIGETPDGAAIGLSGAVAEERAIYIASGAVSIDGASFGEGSMVVLVPGGGVALEIAPGSLFAIAGGAPLDGPRHVDWNLVASDAAQIERARADWAAGPDLGWTGRFGLPDGEDEYIPLPDR